MASHNFDSSRHGMSRNACTITLRRTTHANMRCHGHGLCHSKWGVVPLGGCPYRRPRSRSDLMGGCRSCHSQCRLCIGRSPTESARSGAYCVLKDDASIGSMIKQVRTCGPLPMRRQGSGLQAGISFSMTGHAHGPPLSLGQLLRYGHGYAPAPRHRRSPTPISFRRS